MTPIHRTSGALIVISIGATTLTMEPQVLQLSHCTLVVVNVVRVFTHCYTICSCNPEVVSNSFPITAIKVGVPNLETDLFTNVNKLCSSCDTQSAQAGKLHAWKCTHVPKPVPNLCMSCVQAWTLLVHWSYCLDTPCTLELLLGHSLYTTQVLLGHTLYTRATAWALFVHYTGTAWTLLVH